MRHPDFTLTAGPTTASPRTLAALGGPITFDYDPVFLQLFADLERKVAEVYRTEHDVVLMQGEAVLGLEAAARGLTRPGMTCLNLVSGVYAKWFGDWLRMLGANVVELEVGYDDAIDPAAVERTLAEHPDIELVAVVLSETPSGTVNPGAEIGPLAKAAGAFVIADVVSALGGEHVRPDEWGLDICVAGPQKCLAGPPGMSLVAVSDDAWRAMENNPNAPRSSYLSLLDWKEGWIEGGRKKFAYTPSVVDVHGVNAAIDELLEEGVENVIKRHNKAARACRAGVQAMGLELWPRREEIAANCVTAVKVPEGIDNARVLAHVRESYGVMLSGGYGELSPKVFRLGHMGPAARSLNPVVALSALGRGLADFGVEVAIGDGVDATLEVLAEMEEALQE